MSKARDLADFQGSASALTTGTLPVDRVPYVGRRNLIINGDFKVSQRGDYTSAVTLPHAGYTVDRFKGTLGSGLTGTLQHTNVTLNGIATKALKVVATSTGGGELALQQHVEEASLPKGAEVTASFWIRTNNASAGIRYFDGATWAGVTVTGITTDGQWCHAKVTFTIASSATEVVIQAMATSVTSGDYYEFTQVQLELGSVATPFEHRSYGEELALCQRYFYKPDGSNHSGGIWRCWTGASAAADLSYRQCFFDLPVPMRTAPTSTIPTASGGDAPVVYYWQYSKERVGYEVYTGTYGYAGTTNITTPELDAEL